MNWAVAEETVEKEDNGARQTEIYFYRFSVCSCTRVHMDIHEKRSVFTFT